MDTPQQQALANSLDDLTGRGGLAAVFCAAPTAGGHHWELRSASGDLLAVTARVHNGGRAAQVLWKLATLTGMDAGNDIHAELRGAEDRVLARIDSANAAPATVTITDNAGVVIVKAIREKTLLLRVKDPDALTVRDADDAIVAQIDCNDDGPWSVRGGSDEPIGELFGGDPGPSLSMNWSDWVIDANWALSVATYARTQHLGLRRVTQYGFAPDGESPASQSLAVTLLPLLAGFIY